MLRLTLPIALILTACGGSEEGPSLTQHAAISDCGGFATTQRSADADYCDAEVLDWSYDATTQKLTVVNNRVLLNCCGDHSMTATLVDGVYVIDEVDAPEGGAGRCDCMCVFDYSLEIEGVPSGVIAVQLFRDVTDNESGPALLYDGDFDLGSGSGSEIIDATDVGMWCEPSELTQSSSTSECGGFETAAFDKSSLDKSTENYCDAEVLAWAYDSENGTVTLSNERILLNCCGDHSMTATLIDGVYVIKEVDAPEGEDGRCLCMCVFDFALELDGVGPGSMPIRILREVTDDASGPTLVWEGSLDLALGSGEEIIDETDVGVWCEE